MSVYLDASALLPIVMVEPGSDAVQRLLSGLATPPWVSTFAAAEVASALSRLCRMKTLSQPQAREALEDFDTWQATSAHSMDVESSDVRSAAVIVRRFDLMLRAPDALHVAICRRLGARMVTLDGRLGGAAAAFGVQASVL